MALTLFWRMTLGYAAVLLLSIGSSIYAITQLGGLSHTARVALDTDYRTINHQEALTDAFLSEVRYGGKYLLTQSPSSYDQFRQFKNDVLRYLSELKTFRTSADAATQLTRIEHLHQSFDELFEQEARYIKSGQPYAQSRYQQERDKILDNTLRELAHLKDHLEKNVHDKLEHVDGTARTARNIAIATTLMLLIVGAALSLKMSTSLTKPLAELTQRLKNETVNGHGAVQALSIPEIQELSEVVMQEQRRMREAVQSNASGMERITEELAARAASLKRQLSELKAQIETATPPHGRVSIDLLISETDRLVQYCSEFNASAAARTEIIKLASEPAPRTIAAPTDLTNGWITRELPDGPIAPRRAPEQRATPKAKLFACLMTKLGKRKTDTV